MNTVFLFVCVYFCLYTQLPKTSLTIVLTWCEYNLEHICFPACSRFFLALCCFNNIHFVWWPHTLFSDGTTSTSFVFSEITMWWMAYNVNVKNFVHFLLTIIYYLKRTAEHRSNMRRLYLVPKVLLHSHKITVPFKLKRWGFINSEIDSVIPVQTFIWMYQGHNNKVIIEWQSDVLLYTLLHLKVLHILGKVRNFEYSQLSGINWI